MFPWTSSWWLILLKLSFLWMALTLNFKIQKQPSRGVLRKRCSENMQQIYRRTPCRSTTSIKLQQIYRRTPMVKYDFNKIALQLYWNRTSVWVFSCKFAAYLQNTFSYKNTFGQLLLKINIIFPLFGQNVVILISLSI